MTISPRIFTLPALAALPLAVAVGLGAGQAHASAFQLKENSVKAMGRAFAGAGAAPDDYAVVVNNPAAMLDLPGSGFQFDVTAIQVSAKFSGSGTDALGRPISGGNGGDGGGTKPVPAIYYVAPINDRFSLGAALTVPFGFVTDYNSGWVGRYQAYKSDLQVPALTFSGAFRLNDAFSIGLSAIAQRAKADLSNAIDLGAVLAGPTQGAILPQGADGRIRMTGHDWAYGWQAGLLWKPTDSDRIGLNYHSKIKHELSGNATFQVPAAVAPLLDPAFTNTRGHATLNTPAFTELSWWHTVNDRLSLGASVAYTEWSSFQALTIDFDNPAQPPASEPFGWRDTWFGSIGGDYKLNEVWTLRAGLAVDGTPTHADTRTPRVPDATRRWVSVGIGYKPSETLEINAGYTHLFVNDAHVDTVNATGNRLTGSFDNYSNLLGVSGIVRF
jgi:long-chain fatty acid transport protein